MIGGALITFELIALAALFARAVAAFAEDCCAEHEGVAAGTKLVGGEGRKSVPAACDIARHETVPSA